MTTSKDICMKCIKAPSHAARRFYPQHDLSYLWKKGVTPCWVAHNDPRQFPPEYCPYAAEHVVLRETK